tara:strand:+ start:652 stop:894 length:243 start_codon:yes stop_codon:yes gene_type:complete
MTDEKTGVIQAQLHAQVLDLKVAEATTALIHDMANFREINDRLVDADNPLTREDLAALFYDWTTQAVKITALQERGTDNA